MTGAIATATREIVNTIYPVGIRVTFAIDVDPNACWPWQTWTQVTAGLVEVSAGAAESGTKFALGERGGEENHAITTDEQPNHRHPASQPDYATQQDFCFSLVRNLATDATARFGFDINNSANYRVLGGNTGAADSYSANGGSDVTTATGTGYTGGGQPHNNMQPYEVVNRWQRTA